MKRTMRYLVALTAVALASSACHSPTSPSVNTPPGDGGNRVVSSEVAPANGSTISAEYAVGFSVRVQCAGNYFSTVKVVREDGQMAPWGVFIGCHPGVQEYHSGGYEMTPALQFGQGGHRLSLIVVIAATEEEGLAGKYLFRSEPFVTWQVR